MLEAADKEPAHPGAPKRVMSERREEWMERWVPDRQGGKLRFGVCVYLHGGL